MTIPSTHCEARIRSRIHRKSKSGDWISATFEIHPDDLPKELWDMPEGARVMLAVAQIGDDEQPVPVKKERVPFEDLPPSQQFQRMCGVPEFQDLVLKHIRCRTFEEAEIKPRDATARRLKDYWDIGSSKDLDIDAAAAQEFKNFLNYYYQSRGMAT